VGTRRVSGGGGGVQSYFAALTITDSTLDSNEAPFAGGIEIVGGTATITGTTFSNNSGGLGGGGINFEGSEPGGTVTVANSTFSGNSASDGGGVAVGIGAGTLTLKNVTMANNGAQRGNDLFKFATVNVTNTIFGSDGPYSTTCYTYTTSQTNSGGHNIARDASCNLTNTGDLPNTDALLADLADYGGPTQTRALLAGSPAIGGGDAGICSGDPVNGKDQRGIVRPQGTGCDIGAYEALVAVSLAVPDVAGTYGGTVNIGATLTNSGTPLSGKQVCFTLGGTSLGCDTTDASGLAMANGVSLAGVGAGTATNAIQATFVGDFTNGPASGSGTLTVNKAALMVTAEDASRAYGDPNPAFIAAITGFVNGETLATSGVTGTPSLSATATATSPVGPYAITAAQGSLAATNYSFSFVSGTLTIAPATLTVTADDTSRAYGDPNPTFTARYAGFKNGESFSTALTGAPAFSTTATQTSPTGQYPIVVTVGTLAANNGNYTFSFVDGTLSIGRALLKVTVDNASKVYSAPNPIFTATFSGFLNTDTAAVVSGTPDFSTTATQYSPVGTYTVGASLGTLSAANYDFGPFVAGTLTIGKATTALSAVSGHVTYGDTTGSVTATLRRTDGDGNPVAGATVSFTVNGQAVCGVAGNPACPATNTLGVAMLTGVAFPAGLNAGNHPNVVGASFAGDANHLADDASGPLKVARKILWIKPTDRTVGLKQPNPPTTPPANCLASATATSACWLELADGSAFVNGDDWSALDLGALRFQCSRNPPGTNRTEHVGSTYRITATGVVSRNYDIRYRTGTLTVVP
jgi:hypothetical protein